MKTVKTILIGTPEFAERIFRKVMGVRLPSLEIIAVITAPDKPVGRKQVLTSSPVKKWALGTNFSVLEPDKIRKPEWIEKIKELKPDLIILAAYGQIIPREILEIPKFGALNIHPSLLPKYRGASPIQSAILNGDKETGVTIILMDEEMDHGPILGNSKFKIQNSKITYNELADELANLGTELLISTLPDYVNGKVSPQPQNHSRVTFCKIIKKEDGRIDWNKSAEEIERQIRAFYEWPESYTYFNGKILKITEANFANKKTEKKPGETFLDENKNLSAQTGNGILILNTIQLEGKKPMPVKDFLNGHPEIIGTILK